MSADIPGEGSEPPFKLASFTGEKRYIQIKERNQEAKSEI
tara:strand:+ start:534 stop:653 length:120 start_codon:yes stop_codon:yes gene_type:complete